MSLAYRPARGLGMAAVAGMGLSLAAHGAIAAYSFAARPVVPVEIEEAGLQGREFIDLAEVEMLMAAPETDLNEGDVAQDSVAHIESPDEMVQVKTSDAPILAQVPYEVEDPELKFRIATNVEEETEEAEEAKEIQTVMQEEQTTDGAIESRAAAPTASAGQDSASGSQSEEIGLTEEEVLAQITDWQKDLVLAIAAAKTYPRRAREARAEGEVLVTFTIDAYGRIISREVLETSGWPVLDKAALDLLDGFDRLPAPPASMGAGPFPMRLPIAYSFR